MQCAASEIRRKDPVGKFICTSKNIIKIYHKETGWQNVDLYNFSQHRDKGPAVVSSLTKLPVRKNAENFWTRSGILSSLKKKDSNYHTKVL
jgi:hypothetical protein